MKTLYIHVGWPKTGTSAIQNIIQQNYNKFYEKGILYPQSLQWPDYSHHPFALSFHGQPIFGYGSKINAQEAINILENELKQKEFNKVLISSELSPFYFNNEKFNNFTKQYFDEIKIVFTVRRQSEYILSLYNQLIKDANVRYGQSLFTLTLNNLITMDYFSQIKKWEKFVGKGNIIVIPYSKSVVKDFLSIFGEVELESDSFTKNVNDSLPTESLLLIQNLSKNIHKNNEYNELKQKVVDSLKNMDTPNDKILFDALEQEALDRYYQISNRNIEENYLNNQQIFKDKIYKNIMCADPQKFN